MQTCHVAYKEHLTTNLLFDDYLIWATSFIAQLTLSSIFNEDVQVLMLLVPTIKYPKIKILPTMGHNM